MDPELTYTSLTKPEIILAIDAKVRRLQLSNRKIRAYMRRKISKTRWDEKEEWILNSIILNLAKDSKELSLFIAMAELGYK